MDKRFFLALVLTAIVIVGTPLIFPGASRRPATATADSSARRALDSSHAAESPTTLPAVSSPGQTPLPSTSLGTRTAVSSATASVAAETTTVRTGRTTYAFSSRGGAPVSVVLDSYPSRRPTVKPSAAAVQLVRSGTALARFRLSLGRDTIALDTIALTSSRDSGATAGNVPSALYYTGTAGGHPLRLGYTFAPDSYLVRILVTASNAPVGSALLVELPRTLRSNEADTLDDMNHLGVSFRVSRGAEVKSVGFAKLDSAEVRQEPGALDWVAARNKYFLVAFRAPAKRAFSGLTLQGEGKIGKTHPSVTAQTSLPLAADGSATFDIYAGPQDFERLHRLGNDLDQVNPYGGWLNGAVQPFATIVMRALLWMKRTTRLNYGWVLVLFGVAIRLALWPLNQGAMRTSIKMQRLQPELQAIQKKHSSDPKRQQEAIMKVYKDHGMSPLSPLMGCLPMLLPMPILFALYFVFQNTIEFRGVSFLWLPDISLHDPYYITPLLMGVSMFVMSWIGMRNAPPNPQAKMMLYMMPVMMTVLFLNFASGLNLYYAVQNLAALPQQWLLARERAQVVPAPAVAA